MTVNEMITSFSQYYDKMTNLAAPGYEDSEILLFLNNAQDNFIKARMFGDNFVQPAFEDNQKRVADLRPLLEEEKFDGSFEDNDYFTYSKGILIPDDTMFILGLSALVSRSEPSVTKELFECDFVKTEIARKFDTTTFNKPFFIKPKYYVNGSTIYAIFDGYNINYADDDHFFYLRYIRIPTILAASGAEDSCDLENYARQEIVDIAVREAMQVSQDQRFETKVIEEKNVKTQ